MTQRKRLAESLAEYAMRRSPPLPSRSLPTGRAELRGPRVLDPFASETLAYPRLSPLETPVEELEEPTLVRQGLDSLETIAVPCEPLDDPTVVRPSIACLEATGVPCEREEPTVVYRPWAQEFAREPIARSGHASLATTIARPVLAPMAIAAGAPTPGAVSRSSGPAPARPARVSQSTASRTGQKSAPTPLVRKCIVGLMVAAVVLLGVRELTKRHRGQSLENARPATSTVRRTVTTATALAGAPATMAHDSRKLADDGPLPVVDGKTPERQAVDLIARGAYGEAAVFYDRLARWRDVPAFREAARIAQRKARLSK